MNNTFYDTRYTELYHYGVPGMKWGVRKAVTAYGGDGGGYHNTLPMRFLRRVKNNQHEAHRPFRMATRSSLTDATSRLGNSAGSSRASHVRSQVRDAAYQAKNTAMSYGKRAYNTATRYASTIKAGVDNAFRSAGLQDYQRSIMIGGGILLGAGAIAGGIAAYKHHKNKKNKNK